MSADRITIPLSRTKIYLSIIGSIGFVAAGIWLLQFQNIFYSVVGFAVILFFGATGIYGIIKRFDGKAGLIISDEGIWDNSSAVSVGLIRWSDIRRIRTSKVESTSFLLIDVHNPDEYLDTLENKPKLHLLKANQKVFATPFSISSTALKVSFVDLERIIREQFSNYRDHS